MNRWRLTILLLWGLVPTLLGAPLRPFRITVEGQVWSVPMEMALPLLAQLRDPEASEGAVQALWQRQHEGVAQLLGQPRVLLSDSKVGASESITELRYPTDWDPFTIPGMIPQRIVGVRNPYHYGSTVLAPSSMASRNLGVALEASARLSADARTIEVEAALKQTILDGSDQFPAGHTLGGVIASRAAPRFRRLLSSPFARVPNGQWTLVGSFFPTQPGQPAIFHLLRATGHFLTDQNAKP